MAWITIPNETIRSFTGLPLKTQKLNDSLEYVYKPIRCPGVDGERCGFSTTLLTEFAEHLQAEHPESPNLSAPATAEMVEQVTAWLILEMLLTLGRPDSQQRPNALRRVHRPNDALNSAETWRRAWNSRERPEIKLKKEQYEWLHQLLDRQLPLAAAAKTEGELPQTVGEFLYGLNGDNVRQALTTLPERRPDIDEGEKA